MSASTFPKLPPSPYYAVIFSSQRTEGGKVYTEMADRMVLRIGRAAAPMSIAG